MTLLLKLAAFGSVLVAVLSAYPGVLADVAFVAILFFPIWIPALGLALLLYARSAGKLTGPGPPADDEIGGRTRPSPRLLRNVVPVAIVVVCLVSVRYGAPMRVAFRHARPSFERHIATAPSRPYGTEPLGRMLGVYHVDRYAADPRGGVYFRTHSGPAGIGPDTMSHGFTYKPNPEGTPFGRAGYHCSRIDGDWYVFSASNDY